MPVDQEAYVRADLDTLVIVLYCACSRICPASRATASAAGR
jgi:hypothetical protein